MLYAEIDNSLVVSTDVAGIQCGWPPDVMRLYQQAGFGKVLLEVVPFTFAYPWIVAASRNIYHPRPHIAGIHGQLGFAQPGNATLLNRFKVGLADFLIPNLSHLGIRHELIGCFQDYPIYVNIHTELASRQLDTYTRLFRDCAWSFLSIENGSGSDALDKVSSFVKKSRDDGAKHTTGLFDVVHALINLGVNSMDFTDIQPVWSKMLSKIDPDIFHQMHLPIGLNRLDSLPMADLMNRGKSMLKDLGDVVQSSHIRIIIENQHGPFGANFKQEKSRLIQIYEALIQSLILKPSSPAHIQPAVQILDK
jgi:hypothetical protein